MKLIAYILEIFGWIRIALAPTILGCILGLLIYNENQTKFGLIVALIFGAAGLVTGVVLATRISIKRGALKFMTRYPHDQDEK